MLRTLQDISHRSKILDRDTWEALLLFLLAINDVLLSPPTIKDDVADQLCERVLSVLFEVNHIVYTTITQIIVPENHV